MMKYQKDNEPQTKRFPLRIRMSDTKEEIIVTTASQIPSSREYTVLETNIGENDE